MQLTERCRIKCFMAGQRKTGVSGRARQKSEVVIGF